MNVTKHALSVEPITKTCTLCLKTKPNTDFSPMARGMHGTSARCRPCCNHRSAERSMIVKPKRSTLEVRRAQQLMKKFGITLDQWNAMFAAQAGRCAICGTKTPGGTGQFHVDHDHITGVVRELLCCTCNVGIGMLGDDPERIRNAADYLQRHMNAAM